MGTFEDVNDLQLRTSCFCCVCALDDCNDLMTVKEQLNCLCLQRAYECQCFQCTDEKKHSLACSQGSCIFKQCSMIPLPKEDTLKDENGNDIDYYGCAKVGGRFAYICCLVAKVNSSCCDPIEMPSTCVKGMAQVLCIHQRVAIPCDDDVPCEVYCCGQELYSAGKE